MPRRSVILLPAAPGASRRELPVVSLDSGQPGPTVLITANVHGDEVTGVGVIHELVDRLEPMLRAGRVHLYPSLNPGGLEQQTREMPPEKQDLNRVWPGNTQGSYAERVADLIWRDLRGRHPALLIDLHADSASSIPYALVDRACQGPKAHRVRLEQHCVELATATGLTVLHEYPRERYLSYRLDRSLSGAVLNILKIPAVTIEAGPRLYLDPSAVETGVSAVLGILTRMGLTQRPAEHHATRLVGGPWRRESGPRVGHAGVMHPKVRPGDRLRPGDAIATIRTLSGKPVEQVVSRSEARVISLPERAWLSAGGTAGTLAVLET